MQASERRASSKLQSTLSNDSDSESEDNAAKQAKTVPKLKKKSQNYSEENQVKTWRDEFDDGLDSDLVGDEDDRDNLNDMTEKQREEELFKRAERREELKKRFEISQKLKLQQKNKEKSGNQSMNSDSEDVDKDQMSTGTGYHQASTDYQGRRKGYEEKYANKFSALNNLKAQREEKEKKELERKEKEKKFKRKHGGGSGSGGGHHHKAQPKYQPNVNPRYQTWVAPRKQPSLGQLVRRTPRIRQSGGQDPIQKVINHRLEMLACTLVMATQERAFSQLIACKAVRPNSICTSPPSSAMNPFPINN